MEDCKAFWVASNYGLDITYLEQNIYSKDQGRFFQINSCTNATQTGFANSRKCRSCFEDDKEKMMKHFFVTV